MKRCLPCVLLLILLNLRMESYAEQRNEIDFPDVPRISAYEAYVKYKNRKAIIIHAGGESFERRHILGAINLNGEAVERGDIKLPNFPKGEMEIFTYCY